MIVDDSVRISPAARLAPAFLRVLSVVAFAASVVAGYAMGGIVVAVLLAAGSGLVIATIVRPETAVLAAAVLIYSNAAALAVTFHGAPALVAAAVPLLLVAPCLYYLGLQRRPLIISPVLALMLVLLAIQVVSALFAKDAGDATGYVITFVLEGLIVVVLVTNAVRDGRTLYLAMWALLLTGAFLGAISAIQQATGSYYTSYFGFARLGDGVVPAVSPDGVTTLRPRLAGPVGESNYYAQYLLMLVPLGVALATFEKRRGLQVAAIGATAFVALGIALAASRGAALGFVIVVVFMTILRYIRPAHLIAGGVAAVIGLSALAPGYLTRLASLEEVASGTDDPDAAVIGRIGENRSAMLAFADHPIIGVGPGQFRHYYQSYARKLGADVHEGARVAHSLYLSTAAELGVLGFLAFAGVVMSTMFPLLAARLRARRIRVRDPAVGHLAGAFFVSMIGFLATGVFLDLAFARYFWLMVALAAVAARLSTAANRTAPADSETDPASQRGVLAAVRPRPG
jgi:O-antigen ligase